MKKFKQFITEKVQDNATLQKIYRELDAKLFNGALKEIPIKFGKLPKQQMGLTTYKIYKQSRVVLPETIEIVIAPLNFTEETLTKIVAHEMIHAFIAKNSISDYGMHGPVFQKYRKEFSQKLGMDIPIDHTGHPDEYDHLPSKTMIAFIYRKENIDNYFIALFPLSKQNEIMQPASEHINLFTSGKVIPKLKEGMIVVIDTKLHHRFKVNMKWSYKTVANYDTKTSNIEDLGKISKVLYKQQAN
jgi:hypothetical protein